MRGRGWIQGSRAIYGRRNYLLEYIGRVFEIAGLEVKMCVSTDRQSGEH